MLLTFSLAGMSLAEEGLRLEPGKNRVSGVEGGGVVGRTWLSLLCFLRSSLCLEVFESSWSLSGSLVFQGQVGGGSPHFPLSSHLPSTPSSGTDFWYQGAWSLSPLAVTVAHRYQTLYRGSSWPQTCYEFTETPWGSDSNPFYRQQHWGSESSMTGIKLLMLGLLFHPNLLTSHLVFIPLPGSWLLGPGQGSRVQTGQEEIVLLEMDWWGGWGSTGAGMLRVWVSLNRLKRQKIWSWSSPGKEVRAGCLGSMAASFQSWKFGREDQDFFPTLFEFWGDPGKQPIKPTWSCCHYNPTKG